LFTSVLSMSIAGPVFKLMPDVEPVVRAAWRLQGTCMLYSVLCTIQLWNWSTEICFTFYKDPWNVFMIMIAGLSYALHMVLFVWSLEHTSLTLSLLLVSMHPMLLAIVQKCIGSESSSMQIIGVVVGVSGAAASIMGGSRTSVNAYNDLAGNAAALTSALCLLSFLVIGKKASKLPLFVYLFPVFVLAALFATIFGCLSETGIREDAEQMNLIGGWMASRRLFVLVLLLALFPGVIGNAGVTFAIRKLSPVYVSFAYLFEPVLGVMIAIPLSVSEVPSWQTISGAAVLILGTVLVHLGEGASSSTKELL